MANCSILCQKFWRDSHDPYTASGRITDICTKLWTQDTLNTKINCYPQEHKIQQNTYKEIMKLRLWWNKCCVWKNRIALTARKIKMSITGAQKLGEKTNSKQYLHKNKKKANINVEILHTGQWWCVYQDMMTMMTTMMKTMMMYWWCDVMWCDVMWCDMMPLMKRLID